jgi:Phosphomannomutase
MTIKFGTDGWRAIIAKDFTVDNVARVAQGTAEWLLKTNPSPTLVLGSDCRFGGRMFAETVALVMAQNGVKVLWDRNDFVSTPMVSLGTVQYGAQAGVIFDRQPQPTFVQRLQDQGILWRARRSFDDLRSGSPDP